MSLALRWSFSVEMRAESSEPYDMSPLPYQLEIRPSLNLPGRIQGSLGVSSWLKNGGKVEDALLEEPQLMHTLQPTSKQQACNPRHQHSPLHSAPPSHTSQHLASPNPHSSAAQPTNTSFPSQTC
ncbi:uncharacterized protein BO72DRAFT_155285 [Aspergillus fijiensis CBS 313.89]|uniref:Uncharacterized protein n=1 Tax=Aspergillus fijiensis CBS 313.89 TaxID=1448319 RepID=A0A8G1RMC1_9EURO|nr:uncharacterized protein BO72DRAFT_155285 [Aspergillus fijiensis CBS 313.89]RAK75864.1 hypothetical protein BO72DRAFT_155285 [Aspergillus fijiensis CBS 313.89]